MVEEEVARFAVGNDSGMYKSCFAVDDAPRDCSVSVGHDSGVCQASSLEDDAVGSGKGMCQAGSPGDDDSRADAFPVDTGMCKVSVVGDDAVGNDSDMCKRRKMLIVGRAGHHS